MPDPLEPVAWRYRNVEWPERTPWQFCVEKPGYDLPEVIEEPLYPASALASKDAEMAALREQVKGMREALEKIEGYAHMQRRVSGPGTRVGVYYGELLDKIERRARAELEAKTDG